MQAVKSEEAVKSEVPALAPVAKRNAKEADVRGERPKGDAVDALRQPFCGRQREEGARGQQATLLWKAAQRRYGIVVSDRCWCTNASLITTMYNRINIQLHMKVRPK